MLEYNMLLSDITLKEMKGMISPFEPTLIKEGKISYGLSSYGYDARIANEFKIFTDVHTTIIDPKNFDQRVFVETTGEYCIIPAHGFILARTVEFFDIPRDITVICLGKSTYARCGIIVNVTPLEAGWRGYVTLELSNTTSLPAKIYANEGVCQFLFFRGDRPCQTSYSDRKGKYMDQVGVTCAKVDPVVNATANVKTSSCGMNACLSKKCD